MVAKRFLLSRVFALSAFAVTAFSLTQPSISAAQPKMRVANDVTLTYRGSLPGMLAVTLTTETSSIRYLDLEQRRILRFATPVKNVSYPAFSPDGQSLAFVAMNRHGNEVYSSDWDGKHTHRVTRNSVDDGNPSWSADGKSVFYYSEMRRHKTELFSSLIKKPFTRTQHTDFGGKNTTPVVSPSGEHVLYSTDRYRPSWNVCMVDLEKSADSCPLKARRGSNCRPHWSPDGEQFVFSLALASEADLYLYTIATRKVERLTTLPHKEYDAVFSPDGEYLAFAHNSKGGERYELKVMRLGDKKIFPLATSRGSLRYLSWSVARDYDLF